MVPNYAGWKRKPFKDTLRLDRGSSPRPIVSFITESEDGVNWIKIGDTKGKGSFISSTKEKITKEGAKKSRRVSKGEIILSNSMSYGKPCILNIDGYIHDGWFVIRDYEQDFYKWYLIQLLVSDVVQRQYKRLAAGGVVANISSELVYSVKVNTPPLTEQQKIAKILSTWDKAIGKLEALIAAKQKLKKALMQQLLTGKKRFAGFEGEWKDITMRKMGKVISGGTPDTNNSEYWNGDILWMTPTDVTALKTRFISDTKRKITKDGVKNSSATVIPSGSLLVCTRATVGLMSISTTDITTNQGFKTLTPSSKFDVNFLYYLFGFFRSIFIRYACGSTFFELSKKDFEKIVFCCPEIKEQQKIASVLSVADEEIETHQKQLATFKKQKKGLMQQLLTGKKRVKIDESEQLAELAEA